MIKLLSATLLIAGMSTSAFAASAAGNGSMTWDEKTNDTFFTDSTMGTMRPMEDMNTRYMALTSEQRDMVKADCMKMMNGDQNTGAGNGSGAADGASDKMTNYRAICKNVGEMK